MPAFQMSEVVRQLRSAVVLHEGAAPTDGQLLCRYLDHGDNAALEALVRRHAAMVWGVCRRILYRSHDAEDAFQATFLVLVRRANSVRPREMLPNWLYGVAHQTALKARANSARQNSRERQVPQMPEVKAGHSAGASDLSEILDGELSRLPEKYRVPIVLCELEGKTRKEAARQTGWPEGTVAGRLARAKALLARRLSRRGMALTAGALTAALSQPLQAATVPPAVVPAAVKAAGLFAAGNVVRTGVISANVIALTEGVLKAMLVTKLKFHAAVLLALISLVLVSGGFGYRAWAAQWFGPSGSNPLAESKYQPTNLVSANDGDDAKGDDVTGSGKEATKKFDVKDFDALELHSGFHATITRGDSFNIAITVDDNVMDLVKVEKEGKTLKIGLAENKSVHNVHSMKAAITVPALKGLHLSGAVHATIKDFESSDKFDLHSSGASHLSGTIEAGDITLKASGASHISLKGTGKNANIEVSGASHLDLSGFVLDAASVQMSGASHAALNVGGNLDYEISGASHLRYVGEPKLGKTSNTGASSVSRAKGSAPR